MDGQTIVALVTALGLGSAVPSLLNGLLAQRSGRAEKERERNADALRLRDEAWERADALERRYETRIEAAETERDKAETRARIMTEYASTLRSMLLEKGVAYEALPEWPGVRTGSELYPSKRNPS